MDDFVVYSKLASTIIDDQNSHAAATICKSVVKSGPQTTLIDDGKSLLDVSSLRHCYNPSIITYIKHAVGLEDWTEHVLHDHGWSGIGDEA